MEPTTKSKSYESKVSDIKDSGIVTIAISGFNNEDSYGDIVRKGAFIKTFKERGKRQNHFLDHEMYMRSLVGLPASMFETETHAVVESKLNMQKQISRDLFEDYKFFADNDRSPEHSFMYRTVKANKNSDIKGEDIAEVQMYEYSTVGLGANENTPLLDLKSYKDIDTLIYELEARLRKCDYSDERGKATEQLLKSIKAYQQPADATALDNQPADATEKKSVIEIINNLTL